MLGFFYYLFQILVDLNAKENAITNNNLIGFIILKIHSYFSNK